MTSRWEAKGGWTLEPELWAGDTQSECSEGCLDRALSGPRVPRTQESCQISTLRALGFLFLPLKENENVQFPEQHMEYRDHHFQCHSKKKVSKVKINNLSQIRSRTGVTGQTRGPKTGEKGRYRSVLPRSESPQPELGLQEDSTAVGACQRLRVDKLERRKLRETPHCHAELWAGKGVNPPR